MTRLRRSRLYFSCRSMESIRQARGCGADVVVLDMEDTTPEAMKAAGRTYLAQALKEIASGKLDIGGAEVIRHGSRHGARLRPRRASDEQHAERERDPRNARHSHLRPPNLSEPVIER